MSSNYRAGVCVYRSVCFMACLFAGAVVFSAKGAADGTNDATSGLSPEKRDPFWPVGYIPKETAAKPKKIEPKRVVPSGRYEWGLAMKKLLISGVSSKGKNEFFAVVNGKVKSVGDTISVDYEGITYTWAVESIKPPGSVKLRRVSAL